MAKIGLIDVDGHNFPNLALMKIASFHKQQGDHVEWCNFFERYDKVYKSKVFTFSQDETTCIQADEIISGGTGYNKYDELFCDSVDPLKNAIQKLNKYGVKNYRIFVYLLVKDIEDAYKRSQILKELSVKPLLNLTAILKTIRIHAKIRNDLQDM